MTTDAERKQRARKREIRTLRTWFLYDPFRREVVHSNLRKGQLVAFQRIWKKAGCVIVEMKGMYAMPCLTRKEPRK